MNRAVGAAHRSPRKALLCAPGAKRVLRWALPWAVCVLMGCQADVADPPAPQVTGQSVAPQSVTAQSVTAQSAAARTEAGSVELLLSPDAQRQLVGNRAFDQARLLHAVRQALVAYNILTPDVDTTRPKVEIHVTDVSVQGKVLSITFGPRARDDHIDGQVVVRSPAGGQLRQFEISASSTIGDERPGQQEAQLEWLYRSFAWMVVRELAGS